MSKTILGLPDFQKFKDSGTTRTSHRRRILHTYPNGGSPLTGILSMLTSEEVQSVEHTWYEKRYATPKVAFRGTNPITSDAPSTGDANDGTNMTTGAKAVTIDHYIKVDKTERLVAGQIIHLSAKGLQFRIESVTRGVADSALLGYIKVVPIRAYTAAADDDSSGNILVLGSAHGEGATGGSVRTSGVKQPFPVTNQTMIERTAMRFSGTVLQQGLEYDRTGPYKEEAKDKLVDHMVGIELDILFSKRSTTLRTSLEGTGEEETVRTMSGILEFLELWDAGTTGLQVNGVTYAPYPHHVAATSDDDDAKRIIDNTSGTVSRKKWKTWAERVGRFHTNKTSEKLVLCGSGALSTMSEMFDRESSFQVKYGEHAYGLDFDTLVTPFGKFHFVSHPIMNENELFRNWMLILDVHSIKFRPLTGRDTKLLKNRQNNGDDFRKDEFLTEFLIEMWHPENNMLIKNVTKYAAS